MLPLLKILIYTFKYASKSSLPGTTPMRGPFVKQPYVLHSIKFQKRMSLYEYVYVGELYILHEGSYIRVNTISVPTVLQVAF